MVHNTLMNHIEKCDHLSDAQFGFRPRSSTQDALLVATRDWHNTMEKGGSVVCIFLDLAKAFDSVPHSLILEALVNIGVRGTLLAWIADYLSHRSQFVVLMGSSSSPVRVTSGVPQGSILGPLLFILALDPMSKLPISQTGAIRVYADDTLLYKPVFNTKDLLALQDDVSTISVWVESRGLRFNVSKTKMLVISRKRHPPKPSISINGSQIEQVSAHRHLGVTITSDLSWSTHILATCCKAKKLVGFLYRNFWFVDTRCLSYLYKALVRPVLEYCACVWDPHHVKYSNRIESVQSFAARLATKKWSADSASLKQELSWPLLSARRNFQKLCVCRRILSGNSIIPPSVFSPHSNRSVRHTNSYPLFQPFVKTNYHRFSFFVSCVPLWNAIPESIVGLNTNLAFKRHLKKYLVV